MTTDGDPATGDLRRLLLDADETITVPPGLWDRVREPRTPLVRPGRRRWAPVAAGAAILAVVVVAFAAGALWQRHQYPSGHTAPGSLTVTLARAAATGPAAGSVCGAGSSNNTNVTTCVSINGSGPKIESAVATATVRSAARTLQECLQGPAGTIGCTQFQSVPAGYTLSLEWSPFADEPPGQYCADTQRLGTDGSRTVVGSYCAQLPG